MVVTTDGKAPFYSIELMPDGHYLLALEEPGNNYVKGRAYADTDANGNIYLRKHRSNKAGRMKSTALADDLLQFGTYTYGTFRKSGDKQYQLNNGITVDLKNATSSNGSITYTNSDGSVSSVNDNTKTPDGTEQAHSLCRSWEVYSFETWAFLNGQYVAHGKQTLNADRTVDTHFKATGGDFLGITLDDLLNSENEFCYRVVFTPSNTYICLYLDGTAELATWEWTDKQQGTLKWTDWEYGYNDYEDDGDGDGYVTVRFAGKQMRIYEDYTYDLSYDEDYNYSTRIVAVNTLTATY